jgi:ribonuclease BN (tRNA processing enzyme)
MILRNCIRTLLVFVGLWSASPALSNLCVNEGGVVLQVLGSGGPIADDGRASSAYLVWVDGRSRILIDAGGGAFLRFAEAGANFRDLDFIGLSHFHADHSAGFPALLKSGNFANRKAMLTVAGPGKRGIFPGLGAFLDALLNKNTGAFAYLAGYLDGTAGLPKLSAVEITDTQTGVVSVFSNDDGSIQIDALHVPHGIVPALAFRVRVNGQTLVFASDQNGSNPDFAAFAKDASILVMHMPVPEDVTGVGRKLHAPPSVIGEIANDANASTLVLSHFMQRSLLDLDKNLDQVQSEFDGNIRIAKDLACYCNKIEEK